MTLDSKGRYVLRFAMDTISQCSIAPDNFCIEDMSDARVPAEVTDEQIRHFLEDWATDEIMRRSLSVSLTHRDEATKWVREQLERQHKERSDDDCDD